jgi:hypothetical protein
VTDVHAEDVLELAAAEDQQPVEAFAADAADPALHARVRVRRLHGRAENLDVLGGQQGVKGTRELRVAIVDQEPHPPLAVVEMHQQIARVLQHPRRVRLARAREVLDAAAADGDEAEHVEATQPGSARTAIARAPATAATAPARSARWVIFFMVCSLL